MDLVQDYCHLLVQEYLCALELTDTSKMYAKECAEKSMKMASSEVWYEVSNRIRLPELLDNCDTVPVLWRILQYVVQQRGSDAKMRPTTVIARSRPHTTDAVVRKVKQDIVRPESRLRSLEKVQKNRKRDERRQLGRLRGVSSEYTAVSHRGSKTRLVDMEHAKRRSFMSCTEKLVERPNTSYPLTRGQEAQRIKMISRDLKNLSTTLQEHKQIEKRWEEFEKDVETEEIRELNKKLCKQKKATFCMLCLIPFTPNNLVLQVTYKSIMDLRASWDSNMEELNLVLSRPPRCYDTVGVCKFCAQFATNVSSYRPSMEERNKIVKQKQAKQAKCIQEAAERDAAKCDPLQVPLDVELAQQSSSDESEDEMHSTYVDHNASFTHGSANGNVGYKKTHTGGQGSTRGIVGHRLAYKDMHQDSEKHLLKREWNILNKPGSFF